MKRSKALLFLLVLPLIACVAIAVLESCQQDDNYAVKSELSTIPSECFSSFVKGFANMSKQKISYFTKNGTIRRSSAVNVNDRIDIAVNFPPNTQQSYIDRLPKIETIEDMARLSHECAADFALAGEGSDGYVIAISREALYGSLEGMIAQSKDYLKSKGMTEEDIQEMLDENDADETSLIVFAWGLSIIELEQTVDNSENGQFSFSSLIPCTKAYAGYTQYPVLNCAIEAIGMDILLQLGKSNATKLTVPVIKKLFKTVLPKIVGTAGLAIMAVEFTICMNR